jgi:hypothetical protein
MRNEHGARRVTPERCIPLQEDVQLRQGGILPSSSWNISVEFNLAEIALEPEWKVRIRISL